MGKAARLRPLRLGEKLRAIRLHLHLSQSELTTRLHLDGMRARHYVSQFETEQREPDLLLLLAYARAGGISANNRAETQRIQVAQNTALMTRFGFTSIPTIVATDAQTGALITKQGALPTAALAELLGLRVPGL